MQVEEKQKTKPDELQVEKKIDSTTPDEKRRDYIGNYEIKKSLGEGSFAKVKLGVHKLTGEKVALKIVDKNHLPDEYSVRTMYREGQILKLLDHPNVIRLYEIMETKKEIILVIEYAAGGELLNYIIAHGRVKEQEAKKFLRQIVDALIYCHSVHVVHRDLKAENFLLDEHMNIKITDFGLSNVFDQNKKLETFCGSLVYSAPELIEGIKYVGPEIDIWSLGVNLFAITAGELPFADKKLTSLHESILNARFKLPEYLSEDCKNLISGMLVVNPKKRLTLEQISCHPWLKDVTEGVNVAKDFIPFHPKNEAEIDQDIVKDMQALGFDGKVIINSILKENYNQAAATYTLLAQRKNNMMKTSSGRNSSDTPKTSTQAHRQRPRANTLAAVDPNEIVGQARRTSAKEEEIKAKPVSKQIEAVIEKSNFRPRGTSEGNPENVIKHPAVRRILNSPLSRPRSKTVTQGSGTVSIYGSNSSTATASDSTKSISRSGDLDKPRSIRFAFNVSTTFSLEPSVIKTEIEKSLKSNLVTYTQENFVFHCIYSQKESVVTFDLELCRLSRLSLHGIMFKRLKGDIWEYKKICTKLISSWNHLKSN